jgi:hypothetical protein
VLAAKTVAAAVGPGPPPRMMEQTGSESQVVAAA